MNQRKTLKEWREMRGMSIDELSGKTGFPPEQIRRWEEIGFDAHPDTRRGDVLSNEALQELSMVLGIEEVISGPDYAPSTPMPGSFTLDPNPDVPEVKALLQYAEELDLRLAVPTKWGTVLKPIRNVSKEEQQAVEDYRRAEAEYHSAQRDRIEAYRQLIEEQAAAADEDNLTVREALEQADQKLDLELRNLGGGNLTPEEDTAAEYEEETVTVPDFYPDFNNPDILKRWDESQEAWAWITQRDFRDRCLIEAAERMYSLAKNWSTLPRLLAIGGWGDEEEIEDFVNENREEIELQVRRREE